MKSIKIYLIMILLLLSIPFSACKKQNTNEKTFNKYFPTTKAVEYNQSTNYVTETFTKRQCSAYSSITYLGDKEWTKDLYVEKFIIEFYSEQNKDVDIIISFSTEEFNKNYPVLVEFKSNQVFSYEIAVNNTIIGSSYLKIELSNPGANGIAGDIYDEQGISNGFTWKISNIKLYASHK